MRKIISFCAVIIVIGGLLFVLVGKSSSPHHQHKKAKNPSKIIRQDAVSQEQQEMTSPQPKLPAKFLKNLFAQSGQSEIDLLNSLDTGQDNQPMHIQIFIGYEDGAIVNEGFLRSQECFLYDSIVDGYIELELYESCDIFAFRMDGLFMSFSEEQWIEFEPGAELDVELFLPVQRTGGLGVSIGKVEDGFVIQRVYPNTPAEELGLQAGDIITEVNSFDVQDLTVTDFIQIATGPAGTTATFRLLGEDGVPRIFTRSPLEG